MPFVYSKRLVEFNYTTAQSHVEYTVPTGITTVIRDISLTSFAGGATSILINRTGGSAIYFAASAAAGTPFHEECRIVLNAGESITVDSFSGSWQGILSGYELG
jgi:hypothetical protein